MSVVCLQSVIHQVLCQYLFNLLTVFLMRKPRLRDVKLLVKGHMVTGKDNKPPSERKDTLE